MNSEPKNWPEMGLTKATLYDCASSLPYWKQYPTTTFLQYIVSDMRLELSVIMEILKMIREADELKVQSSSFSDGRTVAEVCDFMLERASNLGDMLTLTRCYANHLDCPHQDKQPS
jgi:hypothetical protein